MREMTVLAILRVFHVSHTRFQSLVATGAGLKRAEEDVLPARITVLNV